MLHYCCVPPNVPGVSEKARLGARLHFRTLTDNGTVYSMGSSHCSLPWAACLLGFPIPTGRPMALHLCLVISTRFCLFRTSLWWFSSGYFVFPHHSNRPRPPCWYCASMLVVVYSKPLYHFFFITRHFACGRVVKLPFLSCGLKGCADK